MRFRKDYRPTPFLNRRDQHRMLAYCGMMMLVLVAMQLAADPDNWNWMFGDAAGQKREPTIADLELTPLDVSDPPLRDDAFEVPDTAIDDESVAAAVTDESVADSPTVGTAASADNADAAGEASNDVTLSPEFIATIQDNKLGILRAEGDAYWQALANVDTLPAEAFHAASRGAVRFPVLMSDPGPHLGQVLTVSGRLKMLQGWPVQENKVGITTLYEGWMTTADSGSYLWRLLFTRLPDGVEPGDDLDVSVNVTGYFFKRYGYQALESYRTAPMVIVSELTVLPPPPVTEQEEIARDMTTLALVFLGILAGMTGLMVWYFRRSDRRYANSRAALLAAQRNDVSAETLEALRSTPVLNPDRPFDEPK
jgi:hypothetical protein